MHIHVHIFMQSHNEKEAINLKDNGESILEDLEGETEGIQI